MTAPPLRPRGCGRRVLGSFQLWDFPDEVTAPRDQANGRLIPSSIRHSRHAVSLDRSDFCCWSSVVRKYLENFNQRLAVYGGNREQPRICLLITSAFGAGGRFPADRREEEQSVQRNLSQVKAPRRQPLQGQTMAKLIFRCVQTGMNVQVWLPDAEPTDQADSYEAVTCPACTRLHLVNKSTGKILGDKEK